MIGDGSDYIGKRVGIPATAGGGSSARATRKPKPGAGSRFDVLNTFVDRSMRMIDPTAAAVWFVLFRDTKPDGLARASHNSIAERIGRGVRTVYSAVRQLEAAGLLIVVRRGRLNAGVSVYRVRPLVRDAATVGNPLQSQSAIRCKSYGNGLPVSQNGTIRQPAQERGCPDTETSGASEHE
ncbi:MAG: hypothetical protein HZA51_17875 [Planctomycetes bacterium]|nr:hypothetical protein [Planctomycetota bacterium]